MVEADHRVKQAWILWGIFMILNVLINGTIPFLLGENLHLWTSSPIKGFLFNLIQYSLVFLVIPLIIVKGWDTVRHPGFFFPLMIAVLSLTLRDVFRPIAALSVFILAYLHKQYDLSELGFRSSGLRGDLISFLFLTLLSSAQGFSVRASSSTHLVNALLAGVDRLFLNPASTTEYIFYFGFLAERLSRNFGKLWTPVLIGAMYTLHETTNPEYWYKGMLFPMVFIGIAIYCSIYLWRRNIIVIWLGDGFGRFLARLF